MCMPNKSTTRTAFWRLICFHHHYHFFSSISFCSSYCCCWHFVYAQHLILLLHHHHPMSSQQQSRETVVSTSLLLSLPSACNKVGWYLSVCNIAVVACFFFAMDNEKLSPKSQSAMAPRIERGMTVAPQTFKHPQETANLYGIRIYDFR